MSRMRPPAPAERMARSSRQQAKPVARKRGALQRRGQRSREAEIKESGERRECLSPSRPEAVPPFWRRYTVFSGRRTVAPARSRAFSSSRRGRRTRQA